MSLLSSITQWCQVYTCISFSTSFSGLDSEQSPSLFRFSGGSAREHKRQAAEPQDERNQGGASPVSCLQSRAWSFSCLAQHVGISLRECFIRSSLFLSKSIKIIIVCLVYSIFYFSVIPYLNQIRQSIKLMNVSNCETIFLELDHISGWLAFPPVKFKQQTITGNMQAKYASRSKNRHCEEGDAQMKEHHLPAG